MAEKIPDALIHLLLACVPLRQQLPACILGHCWVQSGALLLALAGPTRKDPPLVL